MNGVVGRSNPRELPATIGRYEIARALGTGAMGRVLLARDPVLERHVAIKLLRDDLGIGDDMRDALLVRMRHEARAAARVTHPSLVVIHDMGEDDALGLYLVFEYIEGPTLKQRLGEGRLSPKQAARIAREIGAALTWAHERGVLHRDVKPENIILSPTGPKLTDFGIARIPDSTLTHAGGILGTPAYSGPETFREGKFSPESDQFSLAATLYEAIRGSRAFPGDDAVSVASKIANDSPEPFADSLRYPAELDAALAKGMSRDPKDRFESCKALGSAVMDALLARASLAKPAKADTTLGRSLDDTGAVRLSGIPERPSDAPQERKTWQVFVGGLVLLLVLGLLTRALMRSSEAVTLPPANASETTAREPAVQPTLEPRPTNKPPRKTPSQVKPPSSAPPVDTSEPAPPTSVSAPPPPAASTP